MLTRTGEAETITTHYLFALGAYRALYLLNWIYRFFSEGYVDYIVWVAGAIQTALYSDFFYVYYTKVLHGKKFEIPHSKVSIFTTGRDCITWYDILQEHRKMITRALAQYVFTTWLLRGLLRDTYEIVKKLLGLSLVKSKLSVHFFLKMAVPPAYIQILHDLNREVAQAQPKDVHQFCANYFNRKLEEQRSRFIPNGDSEINLHHYNFTAPINNGTSSWSYYSSKSSGASTPTTPTTDYLHDSEEEMYDDAPSDLPTIPINYNRGRRTSVSAESMAPGQEDYVKTVIPKTEEQRQRIESSIANNFLFKHLDEEQYKDVVDAMVEKRVSKGEEIIRQGGIGDYFYVVETGSFNVYVSKNGAPPERVMDYGPGGSFGELALMYNAPRAATVVATSDSVLWALDRVTFRSILMENTSRKRRMYESFLEEVTLLVSLEPYERHKIADALESLYFEDDELVIKQGDIGNSFYLIESGEARVSKFDEDGTEFELPGLRKGDYFGELALLTNKPRAVNIRAKGRLKVATLNKKAFVRLLGPVVDILKRNSDNYENITRNVQQ
ncbi:8886_t:CDS:2 [Ambispora gerdemannii]|uniref:cAMP-dependent protein kinase regulatory subunit n=1 Tax=Ambispora gerdemannii TaxID=144530 RepID=A0A9N9B188_9GLOM|nr:8886_t:CDS:2 [Ambispora gerdemannii]